MESKIALSQQHIIEYVHKWGSGSVVESLLDPSCKIFSLSNIEGFIGYYANRRCAIIFGDPVCSLDNRAHLVDAFHEFCEKEKKNVIYLVASEDFTKWMHIHHSVAWMSFGRELFLDPQCDPRKCTGKKGITLRGKIRHAEKNNIVVDEYEGACLELETKIQDVATQWLKHRQGPQIYISTVRLFTQRFGKRWFYARQGERLVASLVLNKVESKNGWGLDRIMTTPDAPQGTSEMLVLTVMEKIASEGCRFLTFGATNSTTLENMGGFGRYTSLLAPPLYRSAMKIFKLNQRGKYWDKFQPQSSPSFLLFKKPRIGPYEARCLIKALNVSFF